MQLRELPNLTSALGQFSAGSDPDSFGSGIIGLFSDLGANRSESTVDESGRSVEVDFGIAVPQFFLVCTSAIDCRTADMQFWSKISLESCGG
jgi:hypothetical protein